LTFQSCRLPNYDTVQKERKTRIDTINEIIKNDPNLQKEIDAICKENQLTPQNRETLLLLLTFGDNRLPPCMTEQTLINIQLDKDYKGARKGEKSVLETIGEARCRPYYQGGSSLQMDAYGPGVHMNQYGQPVRLRPDFGGVSGEYLQIKPNAYGPGVHMDQYGRPVREYPWP
jgi:hypothetical protein